MTLRKKKWLKKVSDKHLVTEFMEEAMVTYYLSSDNIREVLEQNPDITDMRDEILRRMQSSVRGISTIRNR